MKQNTLDNHSSNASHQGRLSIPEINPPISVYDDALPQPKRSDVTSSGRAWGTTSNDMPKPSSGAAWDASSNESSHTASSSARSEFSERILISVGPWIKISLIVWSCLGLSGLLYLSGVAVEVLSIPLGILLWTSIIVLLLRGIVNRLQRIHIPRVLGTMVAYAVMFGVIAAIGYAASSPFFGFNKQFEGMIQGIPLYAAQLNYYIQTLQVQYADVFQSAAFEGWIGSATAQLSTMLEQMARTSLTSLVDLGTITLNTLICLGFALVVAFLILVALPDMGREVYRLFNPKYHDDLSFIHVTVTRVMVGYLKGTLIQCAIIALCCIVAFGFLKVPNSMAFGILTGLLNIIPVVGPWLGGLLAGTAALFAGPTTALMALLAAIIIQQVVYTFISPKIMSNSVDVHPILVIFSMMAGMAIGATVDSVVGALVGMLLSVPFAAVAKALFVYYFEKRTGRHIVSADGVFFKGTPSAKDHIDPAHDAMSPPEKRPTRSFAQVTGSLVALKQTTTKPKDTSQAASAKSGENDTVRSKD